jgi:hypothetical protein
MTTFTTKTSGYLASLSAITWTGGQAQVLNGLTNDEWTSLSDEIDNSTNKYYLCDLEIELASAAFAGTDSTIECYLVPCVDGTNYPNWMGDVTTDRQENNQYFVGVGVTSGSTVAQNITVRNIQLPPGKYRWGFRNRANVSLAGSGNVIGWRPHSLIGTDA